MEGCTNTDAMWFNGQWRLLTLSAATPAQQWHVSVCFKPWRLRELSTAPPVHFLFTSSSWLLVLLVILLISFLFVQSLL